MAAKFDLIAMKWKANPKPDMWPLGLSLAMIVTLDFQGQIFK